MHECGFGVAHGCNGLAALDRSALGALQPVNPCIDRQNAIGMADHDDWRAGCVFGDCRDHAIGCRFHRRARRGCNVDAVVLFLDIAADDFALHGHLEG